MFIRAPQVSGVVLLLLAACSKPKEGRPTAPAATGASAEPKAAPQKSTSVKATFDDEVVKGKSLDFAYGRTKVFGDWLVVELSDKPVDCTKDPSDDDWTLWIAVPSPPGGGGTASFGTFVYLDAATRSSSSGSKRLHDDLIKPPFATVTLEKSSIKPGEHIAGKLDLAYQRFEGSKELGTAKLVASYVAGGAFDVVVCDSPELAAVASAPAIAATAAGGEPKGMFKGKPFAAKKAIVQFDYPCAGEGSCAYDKKTPPDPKRARVQRVILGDDPSCDGMGGDGDLVIEDFGGSGATNNRSGAWQPANVIPANGSAQLPWGSDSMSWVRFDKTALPPKPGAKMQVTLVGRAADEKVLSIAGTIEATVCPDRWDWTTPSSP